MPRIRFERTTFPLGGGCSIQLSYRGVKKGVNDAPTWAGLVEPRRIELPTFALRTRRSPS